MKMKNFPIINPLSLLYFFVGFDLSTNYYFQLQHVIRAFLLLRGSLNFRYFIIWQVVNLNCWVYPQYIFVYSHDLWCESLVPYLGWAAVWVFLYTWLFCSVCIYKPLHFSIHKWDDHIWDIFGILLLLIFLVGDLFSSFIL